MDDDILINEVFYLEFFFFLEVIEGEYSDFFKFVLIFKVLLLSVVVLICGMV